MASEAAAASVEASVAEASGESDDVAAPVDGSVADTSTTTAPADGSVADTSTTTASAEGGDADARVAAEADAADATPEATSACVANLATAGFAAANGSFLCLRDGGSYANLSSHADVYCDRATQFCYISGGASVQDGCHPLSCSEWVTVEAGVCDGGPLRCACLSGAHCGPYYNSCSDDDAGGLTVSCGSCYGAPPARLSA